MIPTRSLLSLFVVCFWLLPGVAGAQTDPSTGQLGVKMTPTFIEERVDPGQGLGGQITITNQSSETQTFYAIVRDVIDVDLEGRASFEDFPDTSGAALSSWVVISQDAVTLDPGNSEDISYTIVVPRDAPPGGHFAAIFFDRRPDDVTDSGAGVGFQVGTLLNVQVNGDIIEDVLIREFSTDQAIYTRPPVEFATIVKNEGNVLQKPRGIIEIKNLLGHEVGTLDVNANEGKSLPYKERRYLTNWEDDPTKFYFGRYDAVVSLSYGQTNKRTLVRETSFWIIPAKPLLYIFGGLLAFMLIFYFGTRLYIRQQLRKAGLRQERRVELEGQTFMQRFTKVLIVILVVSVLILMAIFLFYGG